MAASLSLRSARSTSRGPPLPSHAEGRAPAARRRRAATPAGRASRPPVRLAVGLLAALLLAACEPYVEGNGRFAQEARNDVGAFEGVHVESGIAVNVLAGAAEQTLVVSGDENVLQYVETVVRPDHGMAVLFVKSTYAFGSTNPVRADINLPRLRYFAAVDRSTAAAIGVAEEGLEVAGEDGATLTVSGPGGTSLDVHLRGGKHGGSELDASAYPVASAEVVLTGGSTAELDASVRVSGTVEPGSAVENADPAALCELTPSTACSWGS